MQVMNKTEQLYINIEPLRTFFREDIYPKEFAELLDEFLYHYVQLLLQSLNNNETVIHNNTVEVIHYIKLLRDILPKCEE